MHIYKPTFYWHPGDPDGPRGLDAKWHNDLVGCDTLDFDNLRDEETGEIRTVEACEISWYKKVDGETYLVKCINPADGYIKFGNDYPSVHYVTYCHEHRPRRI